MKKILKFCLAILSVIFFCSFFGIKNISAAPCSSDAVCCPCVASTGCSNNLDCVDDQCQEKGKTTFCSFSSNKKIEDLIDKVTNWTLVIALVVAPLMILFGAFYMLTSAGDTKRSGKGKQIIIWASIGLAIFLFAKALVSILRYIIGF